MGVGVGCVQRAAQATRRGAGAYSNSKTGAAASGEHLPRWCLPVMAHLTSARPCCVLKNSTAGLASPR